MTVEEGADYDGLGALVPTADDFGVPSRLLGQQSADFFQLLGRIVALSALLEELVRQMAAELQVAEATSGRPAAVSRLIDRCRDAIAKFGAAPPSVGQWIEDAGAATLRRNEYVHSLWPAQGGDLLFGWRPALDSGGHGAVTVRKDLDEMKRDLAEIIRLVDQDRFLNMSSWVSLARRDPALARAWADSTT